MHWEEGGRWADGWTGDDWDNGGYRWGKLGGLTDKVSGRREPRTVCFTPRVSDRIGCGTIFLGLSRGDSSYCSSLGSLTRTLMPANLLRQQSNQKGTQGDYHSSFTRNDMAISARLLRLSHSWEKVGIARRPVLHASGMLIGAGLRIILS